MNSIPNLMLVAREEWPDADFDIPEDQPLHSASPKDDEDSEDWDVEMDFEQTGGAKAEAMMSAITARSVPTQSSSQLITIRPPLPVSSDETEDDEEGVSTIKVTALPKSMLISPTPIDDDMESAFSLPSDLTQLSLAPLSLNHRASKNSLEWGDKDHTSSSQSSDAYSSLGFDVYPSSNSTSSASSLCLPETEACTEEDEEDDGDLDGLVIPSALFESGQGARKLTRILEMKKKVQIVDDQSKVSSPDPEDDFEAGLVIVDDVELSPSRLMLKSHRPRTGFSRSKSMPTSSTVPRPPSRVKGDRTKSPGGCPPSSARQLQKLRLSPSPPLKSARSQTFQAFPTPSLHPARSQTFQHQPPAIPSQSPSTVVPQKSAGLRGQKSHSGLKPSSPPAARKLCRKASLSSLMEASQAQASGSGLASSSKLARYEAPTAASRAKSYKNPSTSRLHGSENPAPVVAPNRLTMPRPKSRPSLSSVFSPSDASPPRTSSSSGRTTSPPPARPPSSSSTRSGRTRTPSAPQVPPHAPKLLRKPKRNRLYGDGTELDGIDDLPTDREQEGRFRVQPKGYGNRIPGGSYPSKNSDKGTIRRKGKREDSTGSADSLTFVPPPTSLKRTGRIDFISGDVNPDMPTKKKKNVPSPSASNQIKRKPTLIRNLGGTGAAKVVGGMKWNPRTLRWEGNDHVLRDFDAVVGTSTRPALITHLTGSSIGSPVGSFASGARMVGNMIFDPSRMCWISTLPPDEDEPDVFANLADDEDETACWEIKSGTIRAITTASSSSSEAPSPADTSGHERSPSESGSDRGSRASMVCDVEDGFLESCHAAEERHYSEMKGWKMRTTAEMYAEPDRFFLYEIRALATRKY